MTVHSSPTLTINVVKGQSMYHFFANLVPAQAQKNYNGDHIWEEKCWSICNLTCSRGQSTQCCNYVVFAEPEQICGTKVSVKYYILTQIRPLVLHA